MLQLPNEELISLFQLINECMEMLIDQSNITHIAAKLSQWEQAVGYDTSLEVIESSRHDNAEALYRLGQLYFQFLGE